MFNPVLFMAVLSSIAASSAWPSILTNATLNVTQLDGTNGFTLQHSHDPVYWGIDLAWLTRLGDDWAHVRGAAFGVNIRPRFVSSPAMDCWAIDGTNGFRVTEGFFVYTSGRAFYWPASGYYVGGSFFRDVSNGSGVVVLNPTCEVWQAETSLTDAVWGCTMRYYFTNENHAIGTRCPVGNFLSSGYSIAAYQPYSTSAFVFAVDEFASGATFHDENSADVVRFAGPGKPGWDIEPVGDVNGDGRDDLLLGSRESDRCWLLFGGRGWTGSVSLASLGTNGLAFGTRLPPSSPGNPQAYAAVGPAVTTMGDMNHDGLSDFAYTDNSYNDCSDTVICFGRRVWPTGLYVPPLDGSDGFLVRVAYPRDVAGHGDVNGDGHDDVAVVDWIGTMYVFYGGPFLQPRLAPEEANGTGGFSVSVPGYTPLSMPYWGKVDIAGDGNNDGYSDVLFSAGRSDRTTNFAWLIYGGQSPSAPPQLRTPLWINVGESNLLSVQYYDTPTNIVWTGCKKGDDYCLAFTNGVRCAAYDEPMGVLYFTNTCVLSSSNDQFTIAYTSTNALGSAAGRTTLVIRAVPEAVASSVVALASLLMRRNAR